MRTASSKQNLLLSVLLPTATAAFSFVVFLGKKFIEINKIAKNNNKNKKKQSIIKIKEIWKKLKIGLLNGLKLLLYGKRFGVLANKAS